MSSIQLEINFESLSLPNSLVNGHIEEDKSQEWKDARENESAPVDIIAIMIRIGSQVSQNAFFIKCTWCTKDGFSYHWVWKRSGCRSFHHHDKPLPQSIQYFMNKKKFTIFKYHFCFHELWNIVNGADDQRRQNKLCQLSELDGVPLRMGESVGVGMDYCSVSEVCKS